MYSRSSSAQQYGADQILSHLSCTDERLAFPRQHKDNSAFSGHFKQIGLSARLLQYQDDFRESDQACRAI
jgi:hypothetical protein